MKMVDSNTYLYHTMDGFSEFGGQGRVFELEIRRHGKDIYNYNSKGMMDFRYGISTGDRQECIP